MRPLGRCLQGWLTDKHSKGLMSERNVLIIGLVSLCLLALVSVLAIVAFTIKLAKRLQTRTMKGNRSDFRSSCLLYPSSGR